MYVSHVHMYIIQCHLVMLQPIVMGSQLTGLLLLMTVVWILDFHIIWMDDVSLVQTKVSSYVAMYLFAMYCTVKILWQKKLWQITAIHQVFSSSMLGRLLAWFAITYALIYAYSLWCLRYSMCQWSSYLWWHNMASCYSNNSPLAIV